MNTALFFLFSMLFGSTPGRIVIALLVLWFLDDRYLGLVASVMAAGRRRGNIAQLRRTVEINTADIPAMVELGDRYLHNGNPGQARAYLERAVALGEDGPRALYLLGGALVELGKTDQGVDLLEKALAKAPSIAYGEPYLYLLEVAFAREGRDSEKVDELVEALEPYDSVEVLARAGRICVAAGRKDLGRRMLEEAMRNYGITPRAMRRLARRWMIQARMSLMMLGR